MLIKNINPNNQPTYLMKKLALILAALLVQTSISPAQQATAPSKVTNFDQLFSKEKPVTAKRGVHMHLTG